MLYVVYTEMLRILLISKVQRIVQYSVNNTTKISNNIMIIRKTKKMYTEHYPN